MDQTSWNSMSSYKKADFTYKAIRHGRIEEMSVALSDSSFIKCRRIFPLHIAVEWENIQSLKHIVRLGYHIDTVNSTNDTALHIAIRRSKYELAIHMIKEGARLDIMNDKNENALAIAAYWSEEHFLKFVFRIAKRRNTGKALMNARYGAYGTTLLGLVENNYKITSGRIYKHLLKLGADINKPVDRLVRFSDSNIFFIRVAAAGINEVALQLLHQILKAEKCGNLEGKFEPGVVDQNGDTILHALVSRRAIGAIKLVLQLEGVDLEAKNKDNKTPLNCAIEIGDQAVFNCLVNHGSKLDAKSALGEILPFDQAVQEQFVGAIEVMLKEGVRADGCESTTAIKDGDVQGITWESCHSGVHRLSNISRIAIRKILAAANGNINNRIAQQLQLPKSLLIKIISPFPTH